MLKSISDIPVLFIAFARPQFAHKVFDMIKEAKPKKLYFYCDKARNGNSEELENNNIIKDYIKEISWDCDLKTWFRDENIGVDPSVENAIDWLFKNEDIGIVLEEDCVPSLAFFDFCRQLLPKYNDDKRVWFISGNNFIEDYNPNGYDYIISSVSYQWGWATWRDRWQKMNRGIFNLSEMISYRLNRQFYADQKLAIYTDRQLKRWQDNGGRWDPKPWDYRFQLTMRCNGGLAIIPKQNLVSNIGVYGSHAKKENNLVHNKKIFDENIYEIKRHPPFIVGDFSYANMFYKKILKPRTSILRRTINKASQIFNK